MDGWDRHAAHLTWRDIAIAICVAVAATGFFWLGDKASAQPNAIVGIASVIDGDTIEIHGQRIRLHGVDAPEEGRMCEGNVNAYQRAALALAIILDQHSVTCSPNGSDRYGREVASCTVSGEDVATLMVGQGWARDWPRYSQGAYAEAETAARGERRGLWALECPGLWGDRDYSSSR